jgi:hypothetical protein
MAERLLQRYLVRFEDAGEMRLAFTENVSNDGLFLKTRYPPPPGAGVRMLIRTARGTQTRNGVVVWSRLNFLEPGAAQSGSGAGVRFSPRAIPASDT